MFHLYQGQLSVTGEKYVYEVLVNRLGGLSLPRKSVVRLTDRPDMTLDVYRGRKTTIQQQQQQQSIYTFHLFLELKLKSCFEHLSLFLFYLFYSSLIQFIPTWQSYLHLYLDSVNYILTVCFITKKIIKLNNMISFETSSFQLSIMTLKTQLSCCPDSFFSHMISLASYPIISLPH